jgi:hypothetical protein
MESKSKGTLNQMHEAIGRAVLSAQVFETVFVVCFEMVGMLRDGESRAIDPKSFKTPTKNLIKALSAANSIDPLFEGLIHYWVERRHLLVHRWFQQHGLPGKEDQEEIENLTELADDLDRRSRYLASALAGYAVKWTRRRGCWKFLNEHTSDLLARS